MKLYTYFRSSAAYRVRIALELKGVAREDVFVHLRRGEQREPDYRELNPQGLVPTLCDGDTAIGQSLAILEYLEEKHPEPPLLPKDPAGRARVRQLALAVACDIHPLQNMGPLGLLQSEFGLSSDDAIRWARRWIEHGLGGVEGLLAGHPATGRFCHGDAPGLADLCLVPQVYNARGRACDLGPYPTVQRVVSECLKLEAFARAAPEAQPDADA